jgi:hypothetical protein
MSCTAYFVRGSLVALGHFVLDAAPNDQELHLLGFEAGFEDVHGLVNSDGTAAIEQVYRRVTVLGPRVDGVVRFLDHDRSRDAVRLKLVERVGDDRGFGVHRRCDHRLRDRGFEFDRSGLATEHFNQKVRSQTGLLVFLERKSLFVFPEPFSEGFGILTFDVLPTFRGSRRNRACGYHQCGSHEESLKPSKKAGPRCHGHGRDGADDETASDNL